MFPTGPIAADSAVAMSATWTLLFVTLASVAIIGAALWAWVGLYRSRFAACRRAVEASRPGWRCCWATPTSTDEPILDEKGRLDPSADVLFAYGRDGVELWRIREPRMLAHLDRSDIIRICATTVHDRWGAPAHGLRITLAGRPDRDFMVHAANPNVLGDSRDRDYAALMVEISQALEMEIVEPASGSTMR